MDSTTIIVCGSYELITLIGNVVVKSSNNVIFLSCEKPLKDTFKEIKIHHVKSQKECEEFIVKKLESQNNFLVSSYWPWKFSKDIIQNFKAQSLNFHPSPLPKDRGWFPHVHQIRKNEPSGVTLHVIDEELDKGDIWIQKKVKLPYPITSGIAHELLKKEIVNIFNENWMKILNSKIIPTKQEVGGNFYSKFLLETPEIVKIKEGSAEDILIRKIASRNFNNKSYIKLKIDEAEEKFIHINFSDGGEVD